MEKIGRTKIVDLLKRTDIGAMVNVKGWVRTRRGSKQVNLSLIHISCHHSRISSMEEWKIGFDSNIYQNVPW